MRHVKSIGCKADDNGRLDVFICYTNGRNSRDYRGITWRRQSRLAHRIYHLSQTGQVTVRPYLIGFAGWKATRI